MRNSSENFPILGGNPIYMLCIHQKFYPQSRMKSNPECCLLGPILVGMVGFWTFPRWPLWTGTNDQCWGPASSPGMAFSDTGCVSWMLKQLLDEALMWTDSGMSTCSEHLRSTGGASAIKEQQQQRAGASGCRELELPERQRGWRSMTGERRFSHERRKTVRVNLGAGLGSRTFPFPLSCYAQPSIDFYLCYCAFLLPWTLRALNINLVFFMYY